jgi:hypothetical protein
LLLFRFRTKKSEKELAIFRPWLYLPHISAAVARYSLENANGTVKRRKPFIYYSAARLVIKILSNRGGFP